MLLNDTLLDEAQAYFDKKLPRNLYTVHRLEIEKNDIMNEFRR